MRMTLFSMFNGESRAKGPFESLARDLDGPWNLESAVKAYHMRTPTSKRLEFSATSVNPLQEQLIALIPVDANF